MASPQIQEGYTKIANEILEQLGTLDASGTEWKILMVILRSTYGFHRKDAELSVREISNRIGSDYSHTAKVIRGMLKRNILKEVEAPAAASHARTIGFQKDYTKWASHDSSAAPKRKKAEIDEAKQAERDAAQQEFESWAYAVLDAWNNLGPPFPQARMSDKRLGHLRTRYKESFKEEYPEVFDRVRRSGFMKRELKNGKRWITFEWFIKNDNHYKRVLEGKYDDRNGQSAQQADLHSYLPGSAGNDRDERREAPGRGGSDHPGVSGSVEPPSF